MAQEKEAWILIPAHPPSGTATWASCSASLRCFVLFTSQESYSIPFLKFCAQYRIASQKKEDAGLRAYKALRQLCRRGSEVWVLRAFEVAVGKGIRDGTQNNKKSSEPRKSEMARPQVVKKTRMMVHGCGWSLLDPRCGGDLEVMHWTCLEGWCHWRPWAGSKALWLYFGVSVTGYIGIRIAWDYLGTVYLKWQNFQVKEIPTMCVWHGDTSCGD